MSLYIYLSLIIDRINKMEEIKMKANKNRTCVKCGEHIDKSDTTCAWVTITQSNFFLGDKKVKGHRWTLHLECTPNEILDSKYNQETKRLMTKEVA
jgi:hypothetical protein